MTELILFHHAHGLTDGVHSFADELRAEGHVAALVRERVLAFLSPT